MHGIISRLALLALLALASGCVYFLDPICSEGNRFPFDISGDHENMRGGEKRVYKISKKETSESYQLVDYPEKGKSYDFDVCLINEQVVVEVARRHPADAAKTVYWPLLAKNEEDNEVTLYVPALRKKGLEELTEKKQVTIELFPMYVSFDDKEKYQVADHAVLGFQPASSIEKRLATVTASKIPAFSFQMPQ